MWSSPDTENRPEKPEQLLLQNYLIGGTISWIFLTDYTLSKWLVSVRRIMALKSLQSASADNSQIAFLMLCKSDPCFQEVWDTFGKYTNITRSGIIIEHLALFEKNAKFMLFLSTYTSKYAYCSLHTHLNCLCEHLKNSVWGEMFILTQTIFHCLLINKSKDVTILCIGMKKRNILQIFLILPWPSWVFEIHMLQSPVTVERDIQAWRLGNLSLPPHHVHSWCNRMLTEISLFIRISGEALTWKPWRACVPINHHCRKFPKERINLVLCYQLNAGHAGHEVKWSRSVVSDSLRPHEL